MSANKIDPLAYVDRCNFLLKSLGTFCDMEGIDIDGESASDRTANLIGDAEDVFPAISSLIHASRRVLTAFRALGESGQAIFGRPGQIAECEAAMVHLDAVLERIA